MELPAQLTINSVLHTITGIHPDDGATGSLTYDTPTATACGRVFATSQNGKTVEEVTEADVIAALEATPAAPVPPVITRAQFVIAARRVLGITEGTIFALISQLPAGEAQETARDLWENARDFKRTNTFLNQLAALNSNTAAEIDEVFRIGNALNLD